MKRRISIAFIFLMGIVLCVACAGSPVSPTPTPKLRPVTMTPAKTATHPIVKPIWTALPTMKPTLTPLWEAFCWGYEDICVRWYVGMSTGTAPSQVEIEQSFANHFNETHKDILLDLHVIPYAAAKDVILMEILQDNGPDLIGPIDWPGIAALHGNWLDLETYIVADPTLVKGIDPVLLNTYKTSEGLVALPFAVYPSAIFYNKLLFDKAGLAYPPADYEPGLRPAKYELDGKSVEWNWDTVCEVARRLTLDAAGKNATQSGFDKNNIVQYGFTWGYNELAYVGSFWGSGSYTAEDGKTAQLPNAWKAAWAWTYDGIWGTQPFMVKDQFAYDANPDHDPFNSGKVAMTVQPLWYTCCMPNLPTWDVGALPAHNGKVSGRIEANFFGILKDAPHSNKAFQVLAYINTEEVGSFILGNGESTVVGGMPARKSYQAAWLQARKAQFPWVQNWDVFITNLSFPDSPNTDSYMPNRYKALQRTKKFYELMTSTAGLDLEDEQARLLADLQTIFDEQP